MTVVFVKRECPRHPGRFTMGEPCDKCATEDFHAAMDRIWEQFRADVARASVPASGEPQT